MKRAGFALLICLTPWIARADYDAGYDTESVQPRAERMLVNSDFDGLETLAAHLRKEPLDVLDDHPPLKNFYMTFELGHSAGEADWQHLYHQLVAWQKAVPRSIAARVALGEWFLNYSSVAKDIMVPYYRVPLKTVRASLRVVSAAKASDLLDEVPASDVTDPEYYALRIRIARRQKMTPDAAMAYFRKGVTLAKEYYPLYEMEGDYLLFRENPEDDARDRFNKESADSFPGTRGDILYAFLCRDYLAHYSEEQFAQVNIDYDRAKRGYEARLAGVDRLRWRDEMKFCDMAAARGDHETAKKLFLALQDDIDPEELGGVELTAKFKKESGARDAFDAVRALDHEGRLDEAEKQLLSFTSNPAYYFPLQFFYQRHGMADKLAGCHIKFHGKTISEICAMDVVSTSAELLVEMAKDLPMTGDWEKAEAAARKADETELETLAGKNVLMLCAIHRGDAKLAEEMRSKIARMTTDKPGYQQAEAVLSGAKTWDEVKESLKTDDQFNTQGPVAIAFYFLAQGKTAEAKAVADETLQNTEESPLLESAIYGSVAKAIKPTRLLNPPPGK